MSTRLQIGNFPRAVMEDDLRALFGQFGQVQGVEIVRDSVTGLSRGFAYVDMYLDSDAISAIGRLNFTQYGGRTIGVSRARETGSLLA